MVGYLNHRTEGLETKKKKKTNLSFATGLHNLHIIVDLDFGEQSHALRVQTEGDVSAAVTAAALDTLPVLDPGHDHVDQLAQEMVHVLAIQLRLHRDRIPAGSDTPGSDVALGLERLHPHVGDGLDGHARDVQPRGALRRGLLDVAVDGDAVHLGDVTEGNGLAEQAEDVTTAGSAQGSVLVVGRAVVPFTETLGPWWRLEARRVVDVAERKDVRRDSRLVGLLDARQGEGARDEESRMGIRWWWRSVRVQRTAVVFGRSVLVAGLDS